MTILSFWLCGHQHNFFDQLSRVYKLSYRNPCVVWPGFNSVACNLLTTWVVLCYVYKIKHTTRLRCRNLSPPHLLLKSWIKWNNISNTDTNAPYSNLERNILTTWPRYQGSKTQTTAKYCKKIRNAIHQHWNPPSQYSASSASTNGLCHNT
jgi:hypothetical protein